MGLKMKQGRPIETITAEIQRQAENKRDFLAPAASVGLQVKNGAMSVLLEGLDDKFTPGDTFHDQVSGYTNIPKTYYRKMMAEAPVLLTNNVNHWLTRSQDKRMIRTLDGRARAFLSDRYRPLDNIDLAQAILPVVSNRSLEVVSSEITERRLYMKIIDPGLTGVVNSRMKDDRIRGGVTITNSEIGHGSMGVAFFLERLVCLNGLIVEDAIRKFHVGRRMEVDAPMEMLRDATRLADDKAFWMKVQDVVLAVLAKERFDAIMHRLDEAADQTTAIKNPLTAVEELKNRYSFNEAEKGAVLAHLIEGGDLSQWGVMNAITRAAQDSQDYDRYDEMERIGGKVLELPKKDWASIAKMN